MSRWAACLLLMMSTVLATPAMPKEQRASIVQNAIDDFIVPAHRNFQRKSAELWKSMNGLCEASSSQQLEHARRAFATSVAAWSSGRNHPFRSDHGAKPTRAHTVLARPQEHWPEAGAKDIGLTRQYGSRLDQLAKKSVAVQGFGALEFVLFGTDSDGLSDVDTDLFRCRYGEAIAHNIHSIAERLAGEWSDNDSFAFSWANPGPDNPFYRDETEALTELLEVFINGTELVRDVRLGGFLGKEARQAQAGAVLALGQDCRRAGRQPRRHENAA